MASQIGFFHPGGGLVAALFLLLPFLLPAQPAPKPGTLTTEDGLGFRRVTAVTQDNRGLLWFGTSQGLERYDGNNFVRLNSSKQADFPFPGGEVLDQAPLILNDSTIWLIADGNLYTLDPRTFASKNISAITGLRGKFCSLRQGPDGKIWTVLDDDRQQHLLCRAPNGTFRRVTSSERLRRSFTSVATDPAGNAWWSTNAEGLRLFSPDGTLLHACKPDSFIWYGTKMYYTPVFADRRGRVFLFPKSTYQIWQYHPAEHRHTVVADSLSSPTYSALEDSRGNIWFAQHKSLICWNTGTGTSWTNVTPAIHKALQFSKINALFEDRTNLLWVATDNGLLKMPIRKQAFQNYFTVPGELWGNALRGMFQDTLGGIYFFCETGQRGLHRLDTRTGQTRPVSPLPGAPNRDSTLDNAHFFILDKQTNTAWTLTDQLLQINLNNGACSVAADVKNLVEKSGRHPFARLHDGTFILGYTLDKLAVLDLKTGKQHRLNGSFSAAERDINTSFFLENNDRSIWVGTTKGLFRIHRNGAVLDRFSTKTNPALSNDNLLALHTDAVGRLWIGTFGGGLNCLTPADKQRKATIRVINRAEGLCDNNVTAILEDDAGNIWASTYNGLACYRPETDAIQNFFEEDGLPNNEFNYASFLKDRSGRLWFGGMNGMVSFDPKDILAAQKNPPLCLTWFSRYTPRQGKVEKIQIVDGNTLTQPFIIATGHSWFEFSWALPNYFKPAKNQYYVWLEGLENDWIFLGNTPSVRYNRLPPGSYVLHIKGADSKGNWSAGELTVPITVLPFFYQTWWFYLLVIALVAGLVFWAARFSYQRRLDLERMRTRIASDLHDEVGGMLAGLAMQAEVLEMKAEPNEAARLHHISDISRAAVSKMRDLVWGLDSRRDRVRNLLERMQEQSAEILNPADIAWQLDLGDLPLEKKIPVDVRQHLFLIFKEALTNVVRHSKATEAFIRFGNFDGHFELSVRDNGPVQEPRAAGTGLGLANMKMRARKLGGRLTVEHTETGFCVWLQMRAI